MTKVRLSLNPLKVGSIVMIGELQSRCLVHSVSLNPLKVGSIVMIIYGLSFIVSPEFNYLNPLKVGSIVMMIKEVRDLEEIQVSSQSP